MKFNWPVTFREQKGSNQFETILQRLVALAFGKGTNVDPNNCMRSPTVHAIVTAISRRLAVTPVHVYQVTYGDDGSGEDDLGESKTKLPKHPVALLLNSPNEWTSRVEYWMDLASTLVRHGRYIAVKGKTSAGKVTKLWALNPSDVQIRQDPSTLAITFQHRNTTYQADQIHYIRGPARDFFKGDSPVKDCSDAIELEICAQEFGGDFFEKGAVPLNIFKYLQGFKGFKSPEEENKFIEQFQEAYQKRRRMGAMIVPPGMDVTPAVIENNKAQFIETRQAQRTIICGAFNFPPHLAGDLSSGTFNNVEQQNKDFDLSVMMPYTTMIEAAMERDLLSPADRDNGIRIRFNLDSRLRANFSERQTGLQLQLANGIITQNDWREREGMNPRPGGDQYFHSVQMVPHDANAPPDPNANTGD